MEEDEFAKSANIPSGPTSIFGDSAAGSTPFTFSFDGQDVFGAKIRTTTEAPSSVPEISNDNQFSVTATTVVPPSIFGSNPVGSIFGSRPTSEVEESSEEYEYYEDSDEYYSDEYYDDSEELNEVLEQARQKSTFTFHFDQGTRPEPVTTSNTEINSLDFETTTTTTEPPITTQRFRDFGAFNTVFPILTTTTPATTTTTTRPTTRPPKVEMFDGVIVRQIENNRIKNVGTVDVQEPIVVNSQRPEIVLGTFKNMLSNDDYVNQQSSEEEEYEYYSDEYYSDEYYSDEEYYDDSDIDNRLAKLVVSTTPRPSIFSTTFRPEPVTTFRPEISTATFRPQPTTTRQPFRVPQPTTTRPQPTTTQEPFRPQFSTTFRPQFSTTFSPEPTTDRFVPSESARVSESRTPKQLSDFVPSTTFRPFTEPPTTEPITEIPVTTVVPPHQRLNKKHRQRRPKHKKAKKQPLTRIEPEAEPITLTVIAATDAPAEKPRRRPGSRPGRQRRPGSKHLSKSERLRVIQEKLKNLNNNGRWEKRNQRRKKLGRRVKDVEFPVAQSRSLELEEGRASASSRRSSLTSSSPNFLSSLFNSKVQKSDTVVPKNEHSSGSPPRRTGRRKFGSRLNLPQLLL